MIIVLKFESTNIRSHIKTILLYTRTHKPSCDTQDMLKKGYEKNGPPCDKIVSKMVSLIALCIFAHTYIVYLLYIHIVNVPLECLGVIMECVKRQPVHKQNQTPLDFGRKKN